MEEFGEIKIVYKFIYMKESSDNSCICLVFGEM